MPNPTAAILIIGDEILSGRTRDANAHFLAGELVRIGIDLHEIRVVRDIPERIVAAVNQMRSLYTHVFTSGGIGPTHDDITAEAIAEAFGVPLTIREDARAILAAHYARSGLEFNAARQRMARIPPGAALIDNPISAAPGFSLGNVHVMAGVPDIFQAMVASLLPRLTGVANAFDVLFSARKFSAAEAERIGLVNRVFPQESFLPSVEVYARELATTVSPRSRRKGPRSS